MLQTKSSRMYGLAMAMVLALAAAGCGDNPLEGPTGPDNPGGRDTIVVITPPDTIIVPPPDSCGTCPPDTIIVINPGPGNCGEIDLDPFQVTRSRPEKDLGHWQFWQPVRINLTIWFDRLRQGGGHEDRNIQFVLQELNTGRRYIFTTPGNTCGVVADTSVTGEASRYVGAVTVPAGAYTIVVIHGSRVDCAIDNDNGPVYVLDGQLEWCYLQ